MRRLQIPSPPFRRPPSPSPLSSPSPPPSPKRHTIDLEAQTPLPSPRASSPSRSGPRFEYSPSSFGDRLLVGVRIKNKLDTSKILRIPFRPACKYILLILLLLTAAFFTPQLLPRWLGFEWASPEDLCQSPDEKLHVLAHTLNNLTNIQAANLFLRRQKAHLRCMENSAEHFYHGPDGKPPRFLWPHECTSEVAQVSLTETTCVSQDVNVCSTVGGLAGFLISIAGSCQQQAGPDLCVESTDANRTESLLELEQRRDAAKAPNATEVQSEPIVATANAKVQELIARLIMQVDLASDAFILYSMISIAIGVPLVVYKREKSSRIVSATFGLTKATFIIVFILVISIYDSAIIVFKETDFARLFQNFLNDPCYVDPRFSSKRVALIVDACNNVSFIDRESDHILQKMDGVYYDTRLFGFCKDEKRELAEHPKLPGMDEMRQQYRSGEVSNPGECNSTYLNQETSVAPEDKNVSKLRALLGSGVLAQLLLKFIVTSWILHLIAFIEPMVMHNGKVEVWGSKETAQLNEDEQAAVTRFARDKQMLPLIVFSLFLLLEIILIIYSIATTVNGAEEIVVESAPTQAPSLECTCPESLLPL